MNKIDGSQPGGWLGCGSIKDESRVEKGMRMGARGGMTAAHEHGGRHSG